MNKKLDIFTVAIEVTRRCNMKCKHCMRGNSQNIDLSNKLLRNLLSQIKTMNIIFTGGEPTLNMECIDNFIILVEEFDIKLLAFHLYTNGKLINKQIAKKLIKLYSLCENKYDCILAITQDQYHYPKGISKKKIYNSAYTDLPFFKPKDKQNRLIPTTTLASGNALQNKLDAKKERCFIPLEIDKTKIRPFIDGPEVYLNCKGNIVLNGDLSYEEQDKLSIGNINNNSLYDILMKEHKNSKRK